jgi:hypothetical protein
MAEFMSRFQVDWRNGFSEIHLNQGLDSLGQKSFGDHLDELTNQSVLVNSLYLSTKSRDFLFGTLYSITN